MSTNKSISILRAKDLTENLQYSSCEIISMKQHPSFNENWLHERIKENPSIIGLGDLDLRDHERRQQRAGRLDLLLEDVEQMNRYEVEIQLGATDESHIIRCIEYWDNEKKRFPQYDHYAVIIAEDVTTRFLNVINLLNGQIPLIAIQVKAIKIENKVSLFFTKIIDEIQFSPVEEGNIEYIEKDRAYWEHKASTDTLILVDEIYKDILSISNEFNLKYNKHYIGLFRNNKANNFLLFRPNKSNLNLALKCQLPETMILDLEKQGINVFKFDVNWKEQKLGLTREIIESKRAAIVEVIKYAYSAYYD